MHNHYKQLPIITKLQIITEKNIVISPNFLVWKFCGKTEFPHSFGRIARTYAETVPFHKITVFFAVI